MTREWRTLRPDCRLCERRADRLARALSALRQRSVTGPARSHPHCTFGVRQSAKREAFTAELAIARGATPNPAKGPPIASLTGLYDGVADYRKKIVAGHGETVTRAQARKLNAKAQKANAAAKRTRSRVSASPAGSSPVNGESRGQHSAGDYMNWRRDTNFPTTQRRKGDTA
jgi:hypothetical protein